MHTSIQHKLQEAFGFFQISAKKVSALLISLFAFQGTPNPNCLARIARVDENWNCQLKIMNHNRKRTQAHCTSPVLGHNLLIAQSKGQFSRNGRLKSPYLPQCEQTESLHSLTQESLFKLQKSNTSLGSNNFLSDSLHNQNQQSPFSGSSSFGTNLHVSSSTSSETNQQLGNPPFLPHLPAYGQCTSVANSSKNPLIMCGDVIDRCDKEISEVSMKNFLDLARESFDGLSYVEDSLTLTDELDLEYLSEVLDIAISENGENPRLEEIYKAPQVASNPTIGFEFNDNHDSSVAQTSNRVRPVHCLHDIAATNKPRIRWTTELHELFLDAVNKLDGPEKATPKTTWMLMNVKGLTIHHVKSHLQKYRLAKSVEELRQDKTVNSSEEDKPASTSNNSGAAGAHPESGMLVTEALRLQIALQKQLHEQLTVQKDLQLRIEKNGEYLRKILEEQQKTGSTLLPVDGLPSLTDTNSESELLPLSASNDASSSQKGSL